MNKVLMAGNVEDQPELIGENPGCTEAHLSADPYNAAPKLGIA
jgi:hypothetical protein